MTGPTPEELEALRHIHRLVTSSGPDLYDPKSMIARQVAILGDYLARQTVTAEDVNKQDKAPSLLSPRRTVTILESEFPALLDAYALIFALSEDLHPMPPRYARALGFMRNLRNRYASPQERPKWTPPRKPTNLH